MSTHSSIHAWRIPRLEEPGGLQSVGSQRVGHDWVTSTNTVYIYIIYIYTYNQYNVIRNVKSKEVLQLVTAWTDLALNYAKWSHGERKYCMNSLTLGIFLEKFKNKLMKKRSDLWLPEAEGGGGRTGERWSKSSSFHLQDKWVLWCNVRDDSSFHCYLIQRSVIKRMNLWDLIMRKPLIFFVSLFFLLYPYEKTGVRWTYCNHNFTIDVNQTAHHQLTQWCVSIIYQ